MPKPSLPPTLLLAATVAVALAYFYVLVTRPPVPDWKREQAREMPSGGILTDAAQEYGWPKWYAAMGREGGKPGEGEGSPYDRGVWRLSRGGERRSVTVVVDIADNSPAFSTALNLLNTLKTHPDLAVDIFPILPAGKFLADELRQEEAEGLRKVKAVCPQILWTVTDSPAGERDAYLRQIRESCPGVVIISDIQAAEPQVGTASDITILPEPQDLLSRGAGYAALKAEAEGEGRAGWEMGLLAHVLPAADASVYGPVTDVQRGITYFPSALGEDVDLEPGIKVVAVPVTPQHNLHPDSPMPLAYHSREREGAERAYARGMARGGVCVFDNWAKGALDTRVAEAMLSGCLVAMVPPNVEHKELSNLIIPLKRTADAVPAAQIKAALADISDAEFMRMQLNAFIYARGALSHNARIASILQVYERFLDGARGYMFPNQFAWTCESEGERPPWCA